MQFAKPCLYVTLIAAILVTVGMIASSSSAQSNQTRQRRELQQQQSTGVRFEYATLTSSRLDQGGGTSYQAVWTFGDFTLSGESTQSIDNAYRRLSGKLGEGPASKLSNLSSMLTRIGSGGWQLIETTGGGSSSTRTFVRRR